MLTNRYPYYQQHDANDCGPACLRMVSKFYGKELSLQLLREFSYINKNGVSLLGISEAAEKIGFHTMMVKTSFDKLVNDVPLPVILHWNQEHFVVLYQKDKKNNWFRSTQDPQRFMVADPGAGSGAVELDESTFRRNWISDAEDKGVALLLYPTEKFYTEDTPDDPQSAGGLRGLLRFLLPYKKYLLQLLLGMALASCLALLFPLLTQSLLDYGVQLQDKNTILLIMLAQMMIFLGDTAIQIIRNLIFLNISSRVSITILSEFLERLMRLPIRFFDIRSSGDIIQRVKDYDKIENFLTITTLDTAFALLNILVFSIIIYTYSPFIFIIFLLLSLVSVGWVQLFQKKRKQLNYKRFQTMKLSQDSLYEIITGIKEIKLNNSEIARRWSWEQNQIQLFRINAKSVVLEQWQRIGFGFLNQFKNILIAYYTAIEVIDGKISLGMMLGISYIIGQINWPLNQMIDFFKTAQDARISFDRLAEINNSGKEEGASTGETEIREMGGDIHISNLSFQYGSPQSPYVLENINLHIPRGKTTAIVGPSGCGKTTLLKLLLKFYTPQKGSITIGNENLEIINDRLWYNQTGAVMQDGRLFSDTISRNIVIDGAEIDRQRMIAAVKIANIQPFIDKLPLRYTTKLGVDGAGLSAGQKQRLLIARAAYKNPAYLFLDEATSALDAVNERVIIENLEAFFQDKTVVVVAHRLSTVKKAFQIVVMNEGRIVETGTHTELAARKGYYYELVKNQLELGT